MAFESSRVRLARVLDRLDAEPAEKQQEKTDKETPIRTSFATND
jgi:hypothetical protein